MPVSKETVQNSKNNPIFLARYVVEWLKETGKHLVFNDKDGFVYMFNGKIYEEVDQDKFDIIFYDFITTFGIHGVWKSNKLSEIKRAMIASPDVQKVNMDDRDDIIVFNNGVLNIDSMHLDRHSPFYYVTTMANVDFNGEASPAPRYIQFLNSIFKRKDGSIDQDSVTAVCQIGGYLLYPRNEMEKMFVFIGEGANGKSLLIESYKMLFDKKVISYIALEDISNTTSPHREPLVRSRVNFSTEAREAAISSEEIKKCVSGEGMQIFRKYKDSIDIEPKVKLIIASNTRPYFNDTSNGIARRLYMLEFKNKFVDPEEYKTLINPEKHRIFQGIPKREMLNMFEEEKNGILWVFINALRGLKANKFLLRETENSIMLKHEYMESIDTLGTFLREYYENDYSEFAIPLPNNEVLNHYRSWYIENVSEKRLNMSTQHLSNKIKDVFRTEPIKFYKEGTQYRGHLIKRKQYESPLPELDTALDNGIRPHGSDSQPFGKSQAAFM